MVNGVMTDFTTQWMMRRLAHAVPWCFWGELPSTPRTGFRRWLQSRQYAPLRFASAIVAIGEKARDAYTKLVPGVPVFNRPYSCRLEEFSAAAGRRVANDEPVFLFCGQMILRKGIDVLLDAFEQLIRQGVRARLELVGREADLPALLARVGKNARSRISYHGFQPPSALPAWFGRADVFVLPSRHDGWGVVVNQALGARLPVICTDQVGAAHDLICAEKNGLIVPAGDALALAGAMRRLALSTELRAAFAASSAAIAAHLTPDDAAQFWEEMTETFHRDSQ